jgi:hypothetical protein
MITLEVYQRGLLDLVKNRGPYPEEAYLRHVAASPELGMVREIAIWWRVFALEAQCRFTSRLLKRLGGFDEMVVSYFNSHLTSPFVEELSDDFLASLSTHHDPLIRATAQFERAFLKVRSGSDEAFEMLWDRHPDHVLLAIEDGGDIPDKEEDCSYRMKVARDLPGLVACWRERDVV